MSHLTVTNSFFFVRLYQPGLCPPGRECTLSIDGTPQCTCQKNTFTTCRAVCSNRSLLWDEGICGHNACACESVCSSFKCSREQHCVEVQNPETRVWIPSCKGEKATTKLLYHYSHPWCFTVPCLTGFLSSCWTVYSFRFLYFTDFPCVPKQMRCNISETKAFHWQGLHM